MADFVLIVVFLCVILPFEVYVVVKFATWAYLASKSQFQREGEGG